MLRLACGQYVHPPFESHPRRDPAEQRQTVETTTAQAAVPNPQRIALIDTEGATVAELIGC